MPATAPMNTANPPSATAAEDASRSSLDTSDEGWYHRFSTMADERDRPKGLWLLEDVVRRAQPLPNGLNTRSVMGFAPLHALVGASIFRLDWACHVLQRFLDEGADPNVLNVSGETAVYVAVSGPVFSTKPLLVLLNNGADPNVTTLNQPSPFFYFVKEADLNDTLPDLEVMQAFLRAGANCDLPYQGKTARSYIIEQGEAWSTVHQVLVDHEAEVLRQAAGQPVNARPSVARARL